MTPLAVFSSGMAWVKKGNLYGFVNEKGALTIPVQYEKVHNFVYGQAYVSKGGKDFRIDSNGEEAQPRFLCGNSFMGAEPDFSSYKEDGKWGFIDMKGIEYFEERGDGCLNERIDFAQDLQLSASPNPFSEVLNVYFNLEKETKTVKISLFRP